MERTAQQARENWADLLGTVTYTGQPATITRHGKPIAQVTPIGDPWVITTERLNDNSEWEPVGTPEIIYTDAIGIRIDGAAELAADDRGNPPDSQWRVQAWPGSDPNVISTREAWMWETYEVAPEIVDLDMVELPDGVHAQHLHWHDQNSIERHHVIVWDDLHDECDRCGSTTAWNGPTTSQGAPVVAQGQRFIESRVIQCGDCGNLETWRWEKLPGTATADEIKTVADEIAAAATEEQDKRVAEVKARLRRELADMKTRLANLDDDQEEADVLGTDYEPGVYRHETGVLVAWDYVPGAEADDDIITVTDQRGDA